MSETQMTSRALPLSLSSSRPIVIDCVVTLLGVAALVGMGKGIAAIGVAAGLPNACWQLLALRAAAAALVVGGLVGVNRDRLWLFGAAYGVALMASHAGWNLLWGVTLAGVLAAAVRHWNPLPRLAALLPAVVFVVTMSLPGLVRRLNGDAPVAATLGDFALDTATRVVAAGLVVTLLVMGAALVGKGKRAGV